MLSNTTTIVIQEEIIREIVEQDPNSLSWEKGTDVPVVLFHALTQLEREKRIMIILEKDCQGGCRHWK